MSEQEQFSPAPNPARRLRYLLLYLLVAWAMISVGFRVALKDVAQYKEVIEQQVADKTDFQLEIGEMSGRWLLVSPIIEFRDISLKGKAYHEVQKINDESSLEEQGVRVEHLAVELDLIESLFTFSPRIKKVLISGISSDLVFDDETGKLLVHGLPLPETPQGSDSKEKLKRILDNYIFTAEQIFVRNMKLGMNAGKYGSYRIEIPSLTLDNEWFNHQLESRLLVAANEEKPRKIDFVSVFQGNPLDLDGFSARSFFSIDRNELTYLFEHELWPKHQIVQPKNARVALKSWIEINRGVFESIKLDFSIKDILFAYQLKQEESLTVEKQQQKSAEVEDINIDELAFKLELKSEISLSKLLNSKERSEYVKLLPHIPFKLKLKDFELAWGDFQWRNLAIIFEQGRSEHLSQPLAREWNAFYFSDEDDSSKPENRDFARLLINRIPVSLVGKLIPYIPLEESKKKKIIDAAPEGSVQQVQVFAYDPFNAEREVYASAYIKDIGVSAFDKVPGVHGIDFYAEYAPKVLGVELQTFDALLEENFYLFRENLNITSLSANLLLEMIPGDIVISSDIAELHANNISAHGRFKANIPARNYQTGEKEIPAWSLQAHIQPMGLENIKMFFLGKLPESLLVWIDDFLKHGKAEGDIFLFAFLKRYEPYTFATLDTDIDVHNASLDYLPGRWPQVDEVEANVLVHNDRVRAKVSSAKMFDSRLFNGQVEIESYLKENLPRVQISAQSSGSLGDVQKLFLQSELKEILGHVIEDWVLTGSQQSDVMLDLPLSDEPGQKQEVIEVNLKTEDALLAIPDVRLGVKSLSTDLHYSLKEGLSTEHLSALFFDKPIEGKIETHESEGEQVFQISGKGKLSADDLKSWQSFWLFDNLSGVADFDVTISIGDLEAVNDLLPELGVPAASNESSELLPLTGDTYRGKESIVRVEVNTDLKNTAIVLPGTYAKKENVPVASTLQLDVFPDWLIYRMDYGKRVGVVTKTVGENGDFDRGRIHFGDGFYPLPQDSGLVVTGRIDHVDFDEWVDYIEKNLMDDVGEQSTESSSAQPSSTNPSSTNPSPTKATAMNTEEDDTAAIINRVDVTVDRFTGFDQELENLKAFITREYFRWRVDVENSVLKGVIWVPDEELISKKNPIVAKLDYLKITEEQLEGIEYQEVTVKDDSGRGEYSKKVAVKKVTEPYVPDDFMFAQIDIATVVLGSLKNGRWRIDLMPDDHGMDFNVHQLNYGLMTINGTGRWNYSEDKSVTHFKGHLRTAAATKLFSALNLKPSSKSSGLMTIDIKWPGSPMDFDYDAMSGKAGLEIFDGSIVELDIKSKKFKALGIFNLGIVTDILTLKIFKKIGKGIDEALTGEEQKSE